MKTKEILDVLQTNDEIAIEELFSKLYNEYYKLLYFIIIKILKNVEDTENIVNDAFVKAFNNIDKFDFNSSTSSFKSWLVRIGKNEAINYYNKTKKDRLLLTDEEVTIVSHYNDFTQFIDEFKGILNDEELNVLVMRVFYSMKLKDIGSEIDKNTNDTYSIYKRAIKKLKEKYKRDDFI